MSTRLRPLRLVSKEMGAVIALMLVAGLSLAFGMLTEEVLEGDTSSFDSSILQLFRSNGDLGDPIGPAWVEEMGRDITALGSTVVLALVLAAVALYLVLIRKRAAAILMTVAVTGGMIVSTALKMSIDRARPDLPHAARVFTASFPSGHATLSTVTFLIIGVLLTRFETDRRVKVFFVGLAVFLTVIIGVSRIYLGLHYASDVLAGWLVGAAWAILCWATTLHLQRTGRIATNAFSSGAGIVRATASREIDALAARAGSDG